MKKIYFLLIFTVLCFGCSKDDDSPSNDILSPPKWLQGSWEGEGFNNKSWLSLTIEVTSNNVKVIPENGEVLLDVARGVMNIQNSSNESNESVTITEITSTDRIYEFHIEVDNHDSENEINTYRFEYGGFDIKYFQNSQGSTFHREGYYD